MPKVQFPRQYLLHLMVFDQLLHILLSCKGKVTMWLELDVWLIQVFLFTLSIS